MAATPKASGGATRPRPRQTAFRFSEETHANLDMLVRALSPAPQMPVTKAAVVEQAIREMAERRRRDH